MKRILLGCVVMLSFLFQLASADTLQMPSQSSSVSVEIPPRGMTMENVEEHFGEPDTKNDPIGDPPITVWQYSNYTVYFENHHVIHTVVTKS